MDRVEWISRDGRKGTAEGEAEESSRESWTFAVLLYYLWATSVPSLRSCSYGHRFRSTLDVLGIERALELTLVTYTSVYVH